MILHSVYFARKELPGSARTASRRGLIWKKGLRLADGFRAGENDDSGRGCPAFFHARLRRLHSRTVRGACPQPGGRAYSSHYRGGVREPALRRRFASDEGAAGKAGLCGDCGGSLSGEHSIFPAVAEGRPDEKDLEVMREFAGKVRGFCKRRNCGGERDRASGNPDYDASVFKAFLPSGRR